jgi:anti-sigma B factor antagonist
MSDVLQIQTSRIEPDITVFSFAGKIVMGPDSLSIESMVADLLAKNQKKIIFDLSRVFFLDSTGMGVIASCYSKARRADGALRVAGVANRVRDLFRITRLDNVLGFYESVAAASKGFEIQTQPGQQNVW